MKLLLIFFCRHVADYCYINNSSNSINSINISSSSNSIGNNSDSTSSNKDIKKLVVKEAMALHFFKER